MLKIKLYKTNICPYCTKALALLKQKNVQNSVEEINISNNPEKLQEMLTLSGGRKTVPQIFINEQHIGGCDDLYALEQEGKLDNLLNQ